MGLALEEEGLRRSGTSLIRSSKPRSQVKWSFGAGLYLMTARLGRLCVAADQLRGTSPTNPNFS